MRLSIETNALKTLVRAIKPFITKELGTNLPATVSLHANETTLTLTTGGNTKAVKIQAPANVHLRGHTIVPAELLANLVAALPGETTNLDKDNQMLVVTSGSVNTKLTVLQEEWEPEFINDLPGYINSVTLRDAINSVQHSTGRSADAGTRRGVRIEITEDAGAKLITTDGHRLAIANIEDAGGIQAAVTTPREQAVSLTKVFTTEETLKVAVDDAYIYFQGANATAKLALIEGAFPDYRQVLPPPEQLNRAIRVDATALKEAVDRAFILASFDDNNRMDVVIEPGRMVIIGENTYGTLKESVDANLSLNSGTEPFAFSMNTRFFREALNQIKDTVMISVPPNSRIVMTPADSDAFTAIIATLQTNEISIDEALADAQAAQTEIDNITTTPGATATA